MKKLKEIEKAGRTELSSKPLFGVCTSPIFDGLHGRNSDLL
jgi:hypothetical protein